MENKQIVALGLDLGNGFMKLQAEGHSCTEPSVFAHAPSTIFKNGDDDVIVVNNNRILLGNDALERDLQVFSAVGVTDALTRYTSTEYANMLYGFITKTFKSNVTIGCLVLGLPNNHFKECSQALKERFEQKKEIVEYQGVQYLVDIQDVIVLPQPFGVYIRENIINENILVIDLGQGTNDYTHINKKANINNMFSNEDGLKRYYMEVLQYLRALYPSYSLSVSDVPTFEREGIRDLKGNNVSIQDSNVQQMKEKYAKNILQPVIDVYSHLNTFDRIIITGGGAEAFKETLLTFKQDLANLEVAINPQIANAEGFYAFGLAYMNQKGGVQDEASDKNKREKKTTT